MKANGHTLGENGGRRRRQNLVLAVLLLFGLLGDPPQGRMRHVLLAFANRSLLKPT